MTDVTEIMLDKINSMDNKLERVAQLAERVATVESGNVHVLKELTVLRNKQDDQADKMSKLQGGNIIIGRVLVVLGAPIVIAFVIAGLASLFNIKL